MASPSGRSKKTGLRCGSLKLLKSDPDPQKAEWGRCSGLILEEELVFDSKSGLGLRCWKKDCRRFHPLEVLLSQAAEQNLLSPEQLEKIRIAASIQGKSENQLEEKMTTAGMKAYALYLKSDTRDDDRVHQHVIVLARSPKEAASILGGDYTEPEGGRKTSVVGLENRDELYFVGTVCFAVELFRKMDETDRALAGIFGGSGVYDKGELHLLTQGKPVELMMYEYRVMLPDYVVFRGYD